LYLLFHTVVNRLKVIAFTYKNTPLNELAKFFIAEDERIQRLSQVKEQAGIDEIFYLATCNRVEFVFSTGLSLEESFLNSFFGALNTGWTKADIDFAIQHAEKHEGEEALRHLFRVASSLESMLVGEREIITQVRESYESCSNAGLCGDFMRLVMKNTIITAKRVFTDTEIAAKPVSVVSIAYRKLRDLKVKLNARILMIGSGETNSNLAKYLVKHGFKNFAIFNRTLSNAQKLAESLSHPDSDRSFNVDGLDELKNYKGGFDVLISCTSAHEPVVTNELYSKLLVGESNEKIIIDLAMPADIERTILEKHPVRLIDIEQLKSEAEKNLSERHGELHAAEKIVEESILEFRQILRTRKLELKMKEVPVKIREIKSKAISEVFAREIETMDESSKEILSKVLDYMEKKCIGVPMVMAKEIILENK
jgi:glutamyl-tRNA reductase